jgi:hypothetical protein
MMLFESHKQLGDFFSNGFNSIESFNLSQLLELQKRLKQCHTLVNSELKATMINRALNSSKNLNLKHVAKDV